MDTAMGNSGSATTLTAPHLPSFQQTSSNASSASITEPPPPPVPASDPRLSIDHDNKSTPPPPEEHDLFKLPALEALRLLSASVELLVQMTGDIPPTPPPRTPSYPQMSDMQAEKANIVRTHSQQNLARLRQQAAREESERRSGSVTGKRPSNDPSLGGKSKLQAYSAAMTAQLAQQQEGSAAMSPEPIDGVRLRHESVVRRSPPPSPYVVVGEDSQPVNLQHGAITRKFYSKNEPPIPINQYLQRLHQFCPMSAAVYLATSLYIHRLAVEERAIPVTRRNAHRLVLAGLRVAMKALEDLSYPHTKFAKVGGVSETELARLEISFCFLTGFELVVGEEVLRSHWETLRGGKAQQILNGMEVPQLRLERKPKNQTVGGG